MWKDSETRLDYLNFDYLVNAVESIALDSSLTPSTIGIYGDWGSGKSSLMQMVEKSIEEKGNKNIVCLRFNGWLMEGYDDAKTTFCGSILDELSKHKKLSKKAKKKITELLEKIDGKKLLMKGGSMALDLFFTGGIGTLSTLTVETIVSRLQDKVKGLESQEIKEVLKDITSEGKKREEIKNFQKEFKEILAASRISNLVIFVDELDRCKPETVLDIFEAMRLFLFVEGTSFVIGADRRLIDYAIKTRYENVPGNNLDISKEYLEKLIQYPVTIPQLDSSEMSKYMTCLLLEKITPGIDKVIKQIGPFEELTFDVLKELVGKDNEENVKGCLLLSSQLSPILAAKLNGNPRQCKRFLNTLFMRVQMAQTKGVTLKKDVLAKLMLLEYFKPSVYADVVEPNNKQCLDEFEQGGTLSDDSAFKKWANDNWVKEWNQIQVKLSTENLRDYYYFSRGSQRIDQAIKEIISPIATQCLEDLLSKSDSKVEAAVTSFELLSEAEQKIVIERVFDEMIRKGELDTNIFKAYIMLVESSAIFPNALQYIKKVPFEMYTTGACGQMTTLLGKLGAEQKDEAVDYLRQNQSLNTSTLNLVANLTKRENHKYNGNI